MRGTVKISKSLDIGLNLTNKAFTMQLSSYGMIHLPKFVSYGHWIGLKNNLNASKELEFQTKPIGRTAMFMLHRVVGLYS